MRRPSSSLYAIGLIVAGGLVTLWVITRILPAPFGHGPEPVEPYGIVCKLAETLGAMVLAFLAFGQLATTANRAVARRTVALWVVAGSRFPVLTFLQKGLPTLKSRGS